VSVTTLDALVETANIHHIDLLKIDVEGLELEVLEGSRRTLGDLRPSYIQIEFNQHALLRSEVRALPSAAARTSSDQSAALRAQHLCVPHPPGSPLERRSLDHRKAGSS
jgi:hypothetical protein